MSQRPRRLDEEQRRTLACALDEIIPPSENGRLPGAGELGLAETLAEAAGANAGLGAVLAEGLASLDELGRARGAEGFAGLAPEDRPDVLNETGARAPAFLPTLVGQTFAAYYQSPRVLEALALETQPPFPRGYEVPPTDFALLDPVRGRAPFYREP